MTLFCPLGFRVLLQSGLLKAIAGVSLCFSQQAKLLMYGGLECGPNFQRVFRTVLDELTMQEYKRAIEEEEETTKIDADVLENWELLVKKGGVMVMRF